MTVTMKRFMFLWLRNPGVGSLDSIVAQGCLQENKLLFYVHSLPTLFMISTLMVVRWLLHL